MGRTRGISLDLGDCGNYGTGRANPGFVNRDMTKLTVYASSKEEELTTHEVCT